MCIIIIIISTSRVHSIDSLKASSKCDLCYVYLTKLVKICKNISRKWQEKVNFYLQLFTIIVQNGLFLSENDSQYQQRYSAQNQFSA